MSSKWPMVRLGEVIQRVARVEAPVPGTMYRQIGIKLWGGGAYERDSIDGGSTKYSQLFRVEAGDIIVNKIWARNGSVAVVPFSHAGCYASGEFPIFSAKHDRLDPRWIHWLTKTHSFWAQCDEKSRGTSGKNRIRPERFLEIEIPLPHLAEQRRIVARIEELAAEIEEARRLRQEAVEEAQVVNHSAMSAILHRLRNSPSTEQGPISLFAEVNPRRGAEPRLSANDPVSFVPMRAVDDISGTIATPETRLFSEASKGYTCFREGDVIWARITPCMQNGKSAIARNLVNGVGFGSTEFHVLRPGPKISAEWLHALVRHKAFLEEAAELLKGTAGQQRVPESFLKAKVIMVPPLPVQQRIVAQLDALQAEVDRLKALQAETAAELDALLTAILDRAFKGEL